jgi:hypothetical protein
MTAPVSALDQPLRPYQAEACRAVLESVYTGAGRSFSIEVARQGGKNELRRTWSWSCCWRTARRTSP